MAETRKKETELGKVKRPEVWTDHVRRMKCMLENYVGNRSEGRNREPSQMVGATICL